MLVGLRKEAIKVLHHAFHFAAVDEVEFGGVGPIAFVVVDFEAEVWRDPLFLVESISSGLLYVAYHDGCIGLRSLPTSG